MLLVIGIPTYNESDNIANLVLSIDAALKERNLTESTIIVNADNNSPDSTCEVFNDTKTAARKASVLTKQRGKGFNVRAIISYAKAQNADFVVLIDGDITSFTGEWLDSFLNSLKAGADFVTPIYERSIFEGNTTNHLCAPVCKTVFGSEILQPIAGEFAFNGRFANYIENKFSKNNLWTGYGIDIFLTLNALKGGMKTSQAMLTSKRHKPSFGKMTQMFEEVAASLLVLTASESKHKDKNSSINSNNKYKNQRFFEGMPPDEKALAERRNQAENLAKERLALCSINTIPQDEYLQLLDGNFSAQHWAQILNVFIKKSNLENSQAMALLLTPLYLCRAETFIRYAEKNGVRAAEKDLADQSSLISKLYKSNPV